MSGSDSAGANNLELVDHQLELTRRWALKLVDGRNNDILIDYLVNTGVIRTPLIERVFRSVDRGHYCPDHRGFAYKDRAWKKGNLHLYAPWVYSEVLEEIELQPGLSFLNLGSGSGYLSTMAGLILGPYGINHGIEIDATIVNFAKERLEDFIGNARAIDEYDFCKPSFFVGNCFLLDSNCQQYDRVYCGASCPEEYETYVTHLVKVGGILITSRHGKLLKIRKGESTLSTCTLASGSFASLITPPSLTEHEHAKFIKLDNFCPPKLQPICRSNIRAILKKNIDRDYPNLKNKTLVEMEQSSPSYKPAFFALFKTRFRPSTLTGAVELFHKRLEEVVNHSSSPDNNDISLDSVDSVPSSSKKLTSDELIASKHIPRNSDSEMEEDSKNDNIAKEKDNVEKDIEDDDSYTKHLIKRISSLPLPSPLLRYINNDRNNL